MKKNSRVTAEEALRYHLEPTPGKIEINASTPMATQRDQSVLFKRFADVNSIDIELDTEDPEEFVRAVRLMGPSFGGINLEDIKAPECFIIEQRLREEMDIPVFHDDQHGTAVICAAGLLNALFLTDKKIEDVKIVLNGAGAAGIACIELIKAMGAKHDNCIVCDTKGVIYQGRKEGMNQWKSAHAAKTQSLPRAGQIILIKSTTCSVSRISSGVLWTFGRGPSMTR